MGEQKFEYGMIGLGTMGRNLLYNMNDHGHSVAGFDKNTTQVQTLKKESEGKTIGSYTDLQEFVTSLKTPRVIILLVPAGKIVDEVIGELKPLLDKEDLLMDCGNSHFTDTDKRIEQLADSGIHFMGVGISGGEAGARYGPSIMPGGPEKVYERVKTLFESISAKVDNQPCVTWLGPGSAGHYVKMVHNGIEYGIMQLISEAYHILKVMGRLSNEELQTAFSKWNKGVLRSFLIEITADIFAQKDDLTDNSLVDMILDKAKQNGTGGWTSEDAMSLQVPIPVMDVAVTIRDLSAFKEERGLAAKKLTGPDLTPSPSDKNELLAFVEQALYFSSITAYAQGMALLQAASKAYKYDLKLEGIAGIWRGGCIIRAAFLDIIQSAYSKNSDLVNLMMDSTVSSKLVETQKGLRTVLKKGIEAGVPLAAMMNALSYYDSYRSAWLPANLVQAQRDNFGAHTYERIDREGTFHTKWKINKE